MTIFSIGNHIWKGGGKMTIKETLEGLERIEVKYPFEEKLTLEDTKCLWGAKRIIRTLEKADKELGEKKDERTTIPYLHGRRYKTNPEMKFNKGYNQMHDIARPILAKALLELKGLRTKILEMSYEAIADGKRIEELEKKLELEYGEVLKVELRKKMISQKLQSLKEKLTVENLERIVFSRINLEYGGKGMATNITKALIEELTGGGRCKQKI